MKLPLKSVQLTGQVADRLAHVTVKEAFTNPYSEHLEAVYIFPLSGGCAVSSFEMKVGDRLIKATMEERAAARAQYNEALQEGKRTALLEQE
jgi:Ca-activated chloride channel family protein